MSIKCNDIFEDYGVLERFIVHRFPTIIVTDAGTVGVAVYRKYLSVKFYWLLCGVQGECSIAQKVFEEVQYKKNYFFKPLITLPYRKDLLCSQGGFIISIPILLPEP